MSNNAQDEQEKQDFQEQKQPSAEVKSPKKALSKRKRQRLARIKRLKRLENRNTIDLDELWNMIPSFSMIQYRFKSLFSIELRDFLLSLFFIWILYFSSNLGLYLPSRYETVSLNTTLKIGFFKDETIFYPDFKFNRKHSQFSFFYQFKKRDDPFLTIDPEEKNTIEININISTLNMEPIIKKFNTSILKYSDIEIQPLCDITLDHPTSTLDIEIKFIGDMTSYKTFIIKSIVYNTGYLKLLCYYRTIFIIIGFILIFHNFFQLNDFDNIQYIGYFLIITHLPSLIFDIEKSLFGRTIQKVADYLMTQSLLILWVYKNCQKIDNKKSQKIIPNDYSMTKITVTFYIFISAYQMINILTYSNSEYQNIYEHLSKGPQRSDKFFLLLSAFLIFLAYFINKIETGSMRVNLPNFFFFSAQICAFCDELIERCRVVKCIGMVKWMRIFIEFFAFLFMFFLTKKTESESSEKLMNAVPLYFEDESSMSKISLK